MARHPLDLDVLRDGAWQMHYGERFAFEGLLRTLQPRLSIEIGRADGGSLRRIAAHSELVHSFDLVEGPAELRAKLATVEFHVGDSAVQLPAALDRLSAEGSHVDFALVDGDHSPDGVRRDAEALLAAECCRETVILFHDAANDDVRAGLEAIGLTTHPKVVLVMLDLVPGFVVEHGPYRGQIWNGLGLVVLGHRHGEPLVEALRFDAAAVARAGREAMMRPAVAGQPATRRARTAGVAAAALVAGFAAGLLGGRARR